MSNYVDLCESSPLDSTCPAVHIPELAPQSIQAPNLSPAAIVYHALERGASIDVLNGLTAWQERVEANAARKAFGRALAEAKKELRPVIKETQGYGYKYVELASVQRSVDEILAKNGLFYRWRCEQKDKDWLVVTCILSHIDGYSEENPLGGEPDRSGKKNEAQAIGSIKTYLERYTLLGAIGLASAKDDDVNARPNNAQPDEPQKSIVVITAEQTVELSRKLMDAGIEVDDVLKFYDIKKLNDLPADCYDQALAMIEPTIAQRKKNGKSK